jgi:hypothetical protein
VTEFDKARDLEYMGFDSSFGGLNCKNPQHSQANAPATWCEHIERYIKSGQDAELFHPGIRVNVPIFPNVDVYALVHISDETIGRSAPMELEFTPEMGTPKKIPLGFWNPGEGCKSIRGVITDYVLSKCDPNERFDESAIKTRCPNSLHSIRSSRIMAENAKKDLQWKWACIWNIVMEKACTPCIEESSDDGPDNFGIDESVIPAGRRPGGRYA